MLNGLYEFQIDADKATLSPNLEVTQASASLATGLPIGSGEIESGHRYVIQERLKSAGAWWKEDNAAKMLALRVLRSNQDWENYWQNRKQKAAQICPSLLITPWMKSLSAIGNSTGPYL